MLTPRETLVQPLGSSATGFVTFFGHPLYLIGT